VNCRTLSGSLRARRAATAALLLTAALALVGCGASSADRPPATVSTGTASTGTSSAGLRGDRLSTPITLTAAAKADEFTSSAGGKTSLATLQQGHLMLLYFGYTNCPDVCPTTMADLGSALRQLPSQVQARTQVVFVTSDPARDTPTVMKAWLAHFDSGLIHHFIGLTAAITQIDAVAKSVGVPLSPPVRAPDGTITVEHGAQTLAFVDSAARVLWTADTPVPDYAHDIEQLAAGVNG